MTSTELALALPVVFPAVSALAILGLGWGSWAKWIIIASSLVLAISGVFLGSTLTSNRPDDLFSILRGDALSAIMLTLTGAVALASTSSSLGFLDKELQSGRCTQSQARNYALLLQAFLSSMSLAILAPNLGVIWVAIEATTVSTAFLVGHKKSPAALEASWKYVIICSFGITLAFFGTVVMYFSALHSGARATDALDLAKLSQLAPHMNNGATRLALGLLLIGFGTKAGLVPFHTWLADAHSQAPAPVSALMSGVLLSVAFTTILRIQHIANIAVGPGFFRLGLVIIGLMTLAVATLLLVGQKDYKRLLAYSSMETMGLMAVAGASGSKLAVSGVIVLIIAHGVTKAALFLASGQLQSELQSTKVADVKGLALSSPLLGGAMIVGFAAIVGFPPFGLFPGELAIFFGVSSTHLYWVLAVSLALLAISFASIVRHSFAMLLAEPGVPSLPAYPKVEIGRSTALPIMGALALSLLIGVYSAPLTTLIASATTSLGLSS